MLDPTPAAEVFIRVYEALRRHAETPGATAENLKEELEKEGFDFPEWILKFLDPGRILGIVLTFFLAQLFPQQSLNGILETLQKIHVILEENLDAAPQESAEMTQEALDRLAERISALEGQRLQKTPVASESFPLIVPPSQQSDTPDTLPQQETTGSQPEYDPQEQD